jgi:predicted XRE-type DNA-binding protein
MTNHVTIQALPEAELAERWYSFKQGLLGQIQSVVRRQKLSQDYIAARLGVDPAYVSRLIRGRQNMTIRTMHNLARAMNCRVRMILEPIDAIPPSNSGAILNPKPPSGTGGSANTYAAA